MTHADVKMLTELCDDIEHARICWQIADDLPQLYVRSATGESALLSVEMSAKVCGLLKDEWQRLEQVLANYSPERKADAP